MKRNLLLAALLLFWQAARQHEQAAQIETLTKRQKQLEDQLWRTRVATMGYAAYYDF